MAHQGFGVDPVGARHDHQPGGVLVIGFVAQVGDQGQFARLHLAGDLFEDARR